MTNSFQGLSYSVLNKFGSCTISKIRADGTDEILDENGNLRIATSNELFRLDDSFQFVGLVHRFSLSQIFSLKILNLFLLFNRKESMV